MAELSTEDIQFIKELRKAKEEGHISRRDALKGAGVLGVGSLLGGIGANEVVGNARADASTDDEDGDIGTPDNRVDVFADGINSKSSQIDELNNVSQASSASDIESLVPDENVDVVKIEPGEYEIDNPITARGRVIGAGRRNGTTLKKQNDDVLIETGGFLSQVEGLTLRSNIDDSTDGLTTGSNRVVARDLYVTDMGNDGVVHSEGNLSLFENVETTENGRDGFHTGGNDANAVTVFNLDARNNDRDGFRNEGSYNISVIGGYSAYNGGYGYYQQDNRGLLVGIGGESNEDETLRISGSFNTAQMGVGSYTADDLETNTVLQEAKGSLSLIDGEALLGYTKYYNDGANGEWTVEMKSDENFELIHGGTSLAADYVINGGGDVVNRSDGNGFVVRTPDGENDYRIRVDDDGDVVTDQL